ncbi:MAG: GNAT family N-acetyltransferase [Proteobacteria bacterium]|nr:GNAT family N-acetyltransferase [Pseudomonadota bacterium]
MLTDATIITLAEAPEYTETCARWAFEAWGRYNPENTLERRIQNFKQHQNKNALPLTLLALVDKKLAGMASLRANDGVRADLTPWLGSLFVDRAYRSKQIGEQLVDAIKAKAASLGFEELYLLTFEDSLPDWYTTLGWKEIAKDSFHGHPITIMKTEF